MNDCTNCPALGFNCSKYLHVSCKAIKDIASWSAKNERDKLSTLNDTDDFITKVRASAINEFVQTLLQGEQNEEFIYSINEIAEKVKASTPSLN